jgi:pimeloyl-ACP methyl ester carboxylesterase
LRQLLHLPTFIAAPISAIVIDSGFFYARIVDGLDLREVSPVANIARSSTPILLIHGLEDVKTPPSQSRELATANPRDPLWLVPNAGHTGASAAVPDEFQCRVLSWFATH